MTDKMIEKLDKWIAIIQRAISDGKHTPVRLGDLREILLAGKPEMDELKKRLDEQEKSLHGIWKELGESLSELEKRVDALEKYHTPMLHCNDIALPIETITIPRRTAENFIKWFDDSYDGESLDIEYSAMVDAVEEGLKCNP